MLSLMVFWDCQCWRLIKTSVPIILFLFHCNIIITVGYCELAIALIDFYLSYWYCYILLPCCSPLYSVYVDKDIYHPRVGSSYGGLMSLETQHFYFLQGILVNWFRECYLLTFVSWTSIFRGNCMWNEFFLWGDCVFGLIFLWMCSELEILGIWKLSPP